MQKTPNYGLDIYEPNDVTSYLTTYNSTMTKIDADMKVIEDLANKNATDLAALEQQVSNDHNEINNLTSEVSDLQTTVQGNTSNIAGLGNRMLEAENSIQTLNTEIAAVAVKDYVGVMSSGEKTVAVSIGDYTENSLIDIYISQYGLAAHTVEVRPASGGQPNLVVLTFDKAQTSDVRIDVAVREPNVQVVG